MLGKLIKYDFINRVRIILLVLLALLGDSIILAIIGKVSNTSIFDISILEIFVGLTAIVLGLALVFGIPIIMILSFKDFGNRYFKNEGYLTQTLPVKPSTQLLARLINDVFIAAVSCVAYVLYVCIMALDFSVIGEIYDVFEEICTEGIGIASAGEIAVCVILFGITIFVSVILIQWHFNAAYTLGHSGTKYKSRKVMSIVWYILLYMVYELVGSFIIFITDKAKLIDADGETTMAKMIIVLAIVLVFQLISLVVCYFISSRQMTKKLNLE